jgi:hypothetical protein
MKEQNEVMENLEEKTEEIIENATDKVEDIDEEVKEELTEAEVAETKEEISEEVEEVEEDLNSQIKKMKKNDASKLLVKKAKIIVKDAEGQLEKCKLLLSDDLKEYDKAVQELKANGMDASEELLTQLGYVSDEEEAEENKNIEDVVVFEPKDDVAPINIKDVSSGKFTGIIIALLGGIATFGGMAFVASQKLGKTVDLSQLSTMEPIYSWYSRLVGLKGDMFYGRLFMILVALLVVWLIYKIRVSMKASKNLNHATAQLEAAEEYTAQKGSCKDEMDKVDAHIHDTITTLKTYQVLFNEQKGKLQRILHIEGEKEELTEYHEKSVSEMKETQGLINSVKSLMATSMSEEGKLSAKSTLFLHSAKNKMQKAIDRLY